MMRAVFLCAASLAGGFALGWVTTPRAQAPELTSAHIMPALTHGGVEAARARTRLNALELAPASEPVEAFEAPPPPDVAVLFRRDLTAIDLNAARPRVWVVDYTQSFGRRALAIGDIYQDGWRIAAIAPQSVELRRRRESRRVAVFDPQPEGDQ